MRPPPPNTAERHEDALDASFRRIFPGRRVGYCSRQCTGSFLSKATGRSPRGEALWDAISRVKSGGRNRLQTFSSRTPSHPLMRACPIGRFECQENRATRAPLIATSRSLLRNRRRASQIAASPWPTRSTPYWPTEKRWNSYREQVAHFHFASDQQTQQSPNPSDWPQLCCWTGKRGELSVQLEKAHIRRKRVLCTQARGKHREPEPLIEDLSVAHSSACRAVL